MKDRMIEWIESHKEITNSNGWRQRIKEHQRQSCLLYAAQPMTEPTQQSFLEALTDYLEQEEQELI